jgi:hypothetical protein
MYLGIALLAASPAFADRIPVEFREANEGSVYTQAVSDRENEFRVEYSSAFPIRDLSSDRKVLDLGRSLNAELELGSRNLIYFDSNRVDDVILVNERVRSNRFERGGENGDVGLSATITPEPGSGTLLLLGLAGLGMILYRRDALKNAI